MAEWNDDVEVVPVAGNADGEVAYVTSLYDGSLMACNAFLADVIQHVRLLYGLDMGDRLQALNLPDDEKQLSGFLVLLGTDGRLANLNGVELLRILNVDLVGHLDAVNLQADLLFNEWVVEDDDANLEITCRSISFLYGVGVEGDFQFLVRELQRLGSSLHESVVSILAGHHGPYYAWRHVACKLYDQRQSGISPPNWVAVLMDDEPEADR
jgi:hypothetical protein